MTASSLCQSVANQSINVQQAADLLPDRGAAQHKARAERGGRADQLHLRGAGTDEIHPRYSRDTAEISAVINVTFGEQAFPTRALRDVLGGSFKFEREAQRLRSDFVTCSS